MTEYDSIVDEYAASKKGSIEEYVCTPTLAAALGDLTGKKCLDLACGSGHSTRLLASLGAKKPIIGLDISPGQLALARTVEGIEKRDIRYAIADCFDTSFSLLGKFDLITGAYLLHYAKEREQIRKALVRSKFALEDDGRFVGLVPNPDLGLNYFRYGVRVATESSEEGSPRKVELCDMNGNPLCKPFTTYDWSRATYERAFQEAGFNFRWTPTVISDEGMREYGKVFWQEQLRQPNVLCFELTKGGK